MNNSNRNLIIGIVVVAFIVLACICALIFALLVRGSGGIFGAGLVSGSGRVVTETRDITDFNEVRVGSAFEVDIVQSDRYNVTITADDNVMQHIQVTKQGRTLHIRTASGRAFRNTTLRAEVEMPALAGVYLSGATRGRVEGFGTAEDIQIELSGASTLQGNLIADEADFDLSGASTLDITGTADRLTLDASGASSIRLAGFAVREADVEFSGASSGDIEVAERLDVDLSGASRLTYGGDPDVGREDVSGGSSLRRR